MAIWVGFDKKLLGCTIAHIVPSGKLTWKWKTGPFEDVFPIAKEDFPLLC